MKRISESTRRSPTLNKTRTGLAGIIALCVLGFAGTASAVTVDYILTPGSHLFTGITVNQDFLGGTGATPVWLDGALGTPPVNYGGDVPAVTQNIIRVDFTDDGSGNIIDGTVTVTLLDYAHLTDASVPGNTTIVGQNDSSLSGATGTMVGGVVTSWSTNLSGLVHNELSCTNIILAGLCGSFGLPADGTTSIVHNNSAVLTISTAGAPDAASVPMTFNANFSTVSFEIELVAGIGRQYYVMTSTAPAVPASTDILRIMMIGLMALVGAYALRNRFAASGGLQ